MGSEILIQTLIALLPLSPATSGEIENEMISIGTETSIYADYDGPTMEEEIAAVDTAYPMIKNIDTFNVQVGDEFDELEGVYAVDSNEGDVTDNITVTENPVDTSSPGSYYVTYYIELDNGAWYRISRNVVVSDQPTDEYPIIPPTEAQLRGEVASEDDEDSPEHDATGEVEFQGITDVTINRGEDFDMFEGVTVIDKNGREIDNALVYTTGEVNNLEPGDYTVGYSVFDEDGNVHAVARVVTVQ